jgi:hypothetical protein
MYVVTKIVDHLLLQMSRFLGASSTCAQGAAMPVVPQKVCRYVATAPRNHHVRGAWTGRTGRLFYSLSRQPEAVNAAQKPVPSSPVCTLFPLLAARRTSRRLHVETAPGGKSQKQGANDSLCENKVKGFGRVFFRTFFSISTYYKLFVINMQ